jgi:hypothetical protein
MRAPLRVLALASAAVTILGVPRLYAEEVRTADASIVVSSSPAASAFSLSLVEGRLRYYGKVYLLTLRGAQPTAGSTGKVYGLRQSRDIEGVYKPGESGLRNDRGVTIVFDPPLRLSGGQLQIDISSRVYPKASTGQRGTMD